MSHQNRSWERLFCVAALAASLCVAAQPPSGTVRAWGDNQWGQLGNGTFTNSNVPVQVSGLSGAVAVAGGGLSPSVSHSLAVKSDGTVWAWGSNLTGQLGNGTSSGTPSPP